jgi:hypothetical protein
MSVNVLLGLLGDDEVAKYSDAELDRLSHALVREIEQDPAVARRLLAAIDRAQIGLQSGPAAVQRG